MGRIPGKVLILFAITLALANAACLGRCIVQSCQDTPPPCHSHSQGDGSHCPQQNQMKTAVTGVLTVAWYIALLPMDSPGEAMQAELPLSFRAAPAPPPGSTMAPVTLRI
jgi:hypothetical protein